MFIVSLFVFLLIVFMCSFLVVKQQSVYVIERLGKFNRILTSGLSFRFPIIERTAGVLDLRLQQLKVDIETKTSDNVFLNIGVSVQYLVNKEKVVDAFYKLESPQTQISSYVFDSVRAQIPKLKLDDVFTSKDAIALSVKKELKDAMDIFGYEIITVLVIDIDPNQQVKQAMNEINTQQRLRLAAQEKGEANKILLVKNAEAESESKKLQGEGIANQRKAIIEGLKDSVSSMSEATGISADEVMNLVLLTQYFDTMKEMGTNGANNTIFMPSSPSGLSNLMDEIKKSIISATKVK